MNQYDNRRYSSSQNHPILHVKNLGTIKNINQSHAITVLTHKEGQIDIIKRRISALCLKETKNTNKTINNEMLISKRHYIRNQSLEIKLLLQKQRRKDVEKLEAIKNRNLQTRVESYYKTKNLKLNQMEKKRQVTQMIRSKSKQNAGIIHHNKESSITEKYNRSRSIYKFQQIAKEQRNKYLQEKKRLITTESQRQVQHILKLGQIKDHQLNQLGKLQLMMVQRNTSSKMAYEASLDKLERISSRGDRRNSSYFNSRYTAVNSTREKSTPRGKRSINLY